MAEVASRNFHDFHLGDDVYQLAGGLIPEVAERLDVTLGTEPNSRDLGELVGKIGKNKVLRDNTEITAITRHAALSFVERSGVQKAMDRSLLTPELGSNNAGAAVLTGAVANWQDRGLALLRESNPLVEGTPVYYAAGSRIMDSTTERTNHDIEHIHVNFQRYPTEAEYAGSVILPTLIRHNPVLFSAFETMSGDELAAKLFEKNAHLLEESVAFVRVANAGVQLAVQMRKAAQEIDPDFDTDPNNPQVYVLTDSFPLAQNEEQENDPKHYQKAVTALRQVAVTAKMLHEAAGGE